MPFYFDPAFPKVNAQICQFSGGGRGASDSESESEESEVEVDFEDDLEYLRSLDPKETQDQDHYKVGFLF